MRTCRLALLLWLMALAMPGYSASKNLLVLGDSLSAEYGLPRGSGWVALLQQRLAAGDARHQVINASISGETTAGGKARLAELLKQHRPAVLVLELGGNDGLRGLSLAATQANLREMIKSASATGARVLLVGMQVPPNYGPDYSRRFAAMYQGLGREPGVSLVPFLLAGLDDTDKFFQPDRIHPNTRAQPVMLDNVWPVLKPLLK
jgi:acyl-CoA thioesterase-1